MYAYKAAQTRGVTVTVTEPGNTLDIMLLKDMGLGCNPATCLQWDLESLTWQAQAGVTYYIVVEGYQGGTSNFDLTFQCTI